MSRIILLTAPLLAGSMALADPADAAEYRRSGAWAFQSLAVAEAGDRTLDACIASTEGADGTGLVLRLEPLEDGSLAATMVLENAGWALGPGPRRLRIDIGAARWVLPAEAEGGRVTVDWSGDAALLAFLEDLAASSFAGLVGRDGSAVAPFSLKGSRGAIEAMEACAEAQTGQGLGAALGAGPDGDPF